MDISCIETYNLTVEDKFYVMLVLHFILPIFIFIVNGLLWISCSFCCGMRNIQNFFGASNMNTVWNRTVASTGMCLFMVYPSMIEFFLTSVKCFDSLEQSPGDIQISRLRNLPSITCYQGRHMIFTVFVTLPALLIWLLLFPLFVICKMRA